MVSLSLNDINICMNAGIIECELSDKRFYGILVIEHPYRTISWIRTTWIITVKGRLLDILGRGGT